MKEAGEREAVQLHRRFSEYKKGGYGTGKQSCQALASLPRGHAANRSGSMNVDARLCFVVQKNTKWPMLCKHQSMRSSIQHFWATRKPSQLAHRTQTNMATETTEISKHEQTKVLPGVHVWGLVPGKKSAKSLKRFQHWKTIYWLIPCAIWTYEGKITNNEFFWWTKVDANIVSAKQMNIVFLNALPEQLFLFWRLPPGGVLARLPPPRVSSTAGLDMGLEQKKMAEKGRIWGFRGFIL